MQNAALFSMLLALLCQPAFARCPDLSIGETAQDCPWAAITRTWSVKRVNLKKSSPELYDQIRSDSRHSVLKSLWGNCSNFDELAKAQIVDPAILKALAKIMRVHPSFVVDGKTVSFAGLAHTYGYLFSNLKTEFGFKRERWVRGQIEAGFGLPKGLLGPHAPSSGGGTLFSNVTYFFGRIAFRDSEQRLKALESDSKGVAPAVLDFDYGSLKPVRLEEIIPSERVLIHTDLVPFPTDPAQELLVYSIVSKGSTRLITGFPVTKQFADSLLNPDKMGDDRPISTHYNAWVDGISGKGFTGTRRIVQVQYIDWRKQDGRARH